MASPTTRFLHHHSHYSSASKILIFFCLSAFLALALIANLFRASLSTHYLSIATNWVDTNAPLLIPNLTAIPHNNNNNKVSILFLHPVSSLLLEFVYDVISITQPYSASKIRVVLTYILKFGYIISLDNVGFSLTQKLAYRLSED